MSGKLDQTLGEIITTQRRSNGPRGRRSQRRSAAAAAAAPVGGIQKSTKPARGAANAKPAPAKAGVQKGDSKVVVSNLPKDVNEAQIKEYFVQSVGPIKKVELSYGPNSVSRGIATVIFSKPDGASKAFNALNGLLVDGRPIKIEIIVSADKAASIIPPAKTLTERISQPKAQPKSAAANKKTANAPKAGGAAGQAGNKKPRRKNNRPAKKTAEELDSEMADYFVSGNQNQENANTNSAAPATANGGDAPMEDEIL